ncbi:MAG: HpcH/HpaI aldolase family protein [Gemmobacter sp.]|uniref:HpcH/HpaI aldolase family protein n=1 Tax=Gemmobacter sp. TaxID=1898957 RepID=UPI00391DC5B4
MTPLRQRIRAAHRGEAPVLRGPFLAVPSPMVVEIACGSFPDFVCIDMEHGPIDPSTGEGMVRAAAVHRVAALVRVPGNDPVAIAQALDWGAAGVLVPRVNSAAEALAAVDAARYPPEGSRGAGPGRAAGYGRDIPRYLDRARAETVVAVQVETVAGLEAAAEIAAVPGVDLVFVGPGDLGVGLAAAARPESVAQAVDRILAACAGAGCPAGIFAMSREGLAPFAGRIALGIAGSDASVLVAGFDAAFGSA